jgi:hypothetical protein
MTIYEIHAALVQGLIGERPTEDDALALMILLHTHAIVLREPILTERPSVSELAAITQRNAADVLAMIWPDRTDTDRTDYRHWYYLFITRTPYGCVDDIGTEWRPRVESLKSQLAEHPLVKDILPED